MLYASRFVIWSLVWKLAFIQRGFAKCHNDVTILNRADYTIISDNRTWSDARDYCRSLGKELAILETKEEFEFIQQLLRDQAIHQNHWLGASDSEKEGSFKWLDGSVLPSDSTMWHTGEPNSQGVEDCVHAYGIYDFFLNDIVCSSKSRSICENSSCPAKTFSITKGYHLNGNVMETMAVSTLTRCCSACMSHLNCKSVNFDLRGSGVRKMCELNGYSKAGNEESFVESEGFTYAELDM
ncbi:CD209 antigen-like protein C [Asterias amurensis]|uniref:CD209 antigen-like protein C n=1 Tax=Asterias amurensis TaxID=7602 RepID=UPI003AB8B232